MKLRYACLLLVAAAVPLSLMLKDTFAQDAAASRPAATTVGTCSMLEIFANYTRARDLTVKMDAKRQDIQAQDDKKVKALEALKKELESLKPSSEAYEKQFAEMLRLTSERQSWLQMQEGLTKREHYRLTKEMFSEIQATVALVAKQQGVQVVLQADGSNLDFNPGDDAVRAIENKRVLYSDAGIDLTKQVLARLNENYKQAPK